MCIRTSRNTIIVAGSGGQGALRVGQMIAYAAINEGNEATWLPSYGAEMRGGTANCSVVISDEEIPFAMVSQPGCCIVMNNASLAKFQAAIQPGGTLILDSSMVDAPVEMSLIHIFFDGREHFSLAQIEDIKDQVLVVNSLSKTYAMTGWRLGLSLIHISCSSPRDSRPLRQDFS